MVVLVVHLHYLERLFCILAAVVEAALLQRVLAVQVLVVLAIQTE
jgi:hypothetical protein